MNDGRHLRAPHRRAAGPLSSQLRRWKAGQGTMRNFSTLRAWLAWAWQSCSRGCAPHSVTVCSESLSALPHGCRPTTSLPQSVQPGLSLSRCGTVGKMPAAPEYHAGNVPLLLPCIVLNMFIACMNAAVCVDVHKHSPPCVIQRFVLTSFCQPAASMLVRDKAAC